MKRRLAYSGIVFFAVAILLGTSLAQQKPKGVVNVAVPHKVFGDLSKADIVASLQVWSSELVRIMSLERELDVLFHVEDDLNTIEEQLLNGKLDVVVLLSPAFVDLEKKVPFGEKRYPVVDRQEREQILLLAPVESEIQTFDDLKGKKVDVIHSGYFDIVRLWQEIHLFERGILDGNDFYQSLTYYEKSSKAILNVFFGKSDACFVNRSAFDLMKELNPQVGKKLRIVEISPKFVTSVMAARSTFPRPYVKEMIKAVEIVHEMPEGEQILTLFKFEAMVKGDGTYLDSMRELISKHRQLKKALEQNTDVD